MILKKEELSTVVGGAGITASMLNAISRLVSTIYDVGYAIGSSLRRAISKNVC